MPYVERVEEGGETNHPQPASPYRQFWDARSTLGGLHNRGVLLAFVDDPAVPAKREYRTTGMDRPTSDSVFFTHGVGTHRHTLAHIGTHRHTLEHAARRGKINLPRPKMYLQFCTNFPQKFTHFWEKF